MLISSSTQISAIFIYKCSSKRLAQEKWKQFGNNS